MAKPTKKKANASRALTKKDMKKVKGGADGSVMPTGTRTINAGSPIILTGTGTFQKV
jgi:hypothetical protein